MSFSIESARNIFPETLAADVVPATISRFNQLGVED
ncbi:Red carotenoid-binding protein, partial [Oscillatoriales cyanobacterium LEGE 11467]|nr:Red carotenoid-binding protein [Zarconia navalis LEGE 11467]